ncbi:MAG TPA: hydroxyethylthiazole kinase [Symbiobacteriaceae bacterium]
MKIGVPQRVREARPLVHCITNFVSMDLVARGVLAAGARPIMALDAAEAASVASGADALVLNIGTWSPALQEAMRAAGRAANAKGIPVVLDPVGVGAIPERTRAIRQLLAEVKVTAIRGNAGEIAALAGYEGLVRGVDSAEDSGASGDGPVPRTEELAAAVARRYGCLVAATGRVDVVSDGTRTLEVRAGHPLMAEIPGAGCLGAGVLAAALAAGPVKVETAAEALLWLGFAGEEAARVAKGPGSFPAAYLDALAAAAALPEGRIAPPLSERLEVYVIVDGSTPPETVKAVLQAGVKAIQFREKHLPMRDQIEAAVRIRDLCREAGALFLVDDRVDLAQVVEADGVHLGQTDLPVEAARRLLGPDAVIGISCQTPEEARAAARGGADYIGTGPVYPTTSKPDASEPCGVEGLAKVVRSVRLPVVGIGGIAPGRVEPVIRAGACGVSVISAVSQAPDPGAAAAQLIKEVLQAKGRK